MLLMIHNVRTVCEDTCTCTLISPVVCYNKRLLHQLKVLQHAMLICWSLPPSYCERTKQYQALVGASVESFEVSEV